MALMKVIEILTESEKSWEEAAQHAVDEASKTIRNIHSVYLHDLYATVKDGKIDRYRVNAKVTFEIQ
jgi:flavin-binding protein dodecin